MKNRTALVNKVYGDALSPATRAVGETLGNAVRASLRPVDGLVWTLNKSFDWVAARVTAHFEREQVSPEDVTSAPVEILGRVLLGLQLAGPCPDPLPRNMFAHLLGASMTEKTDRKVHPAFVEILRQLVPDEARLVAVITSRPTTAIEIRVLANYTMRPDIPNIMSDKDLLPMNRQWSPLPQWAALSSPENLDFYMLHLERLGLVEIHHEYDAGRLHFDKSGQLDEKCFHPLQLDREADFRHECEGALIELHKRRRRRTVYKDILVRIVTASPWGYEFGCACGANTFFNREEMTFCIPDEK